MAGSPRRIVEMRTNDRFQERCTAAPEEVERPLRAGSSGLGAQVERQLRAEVAFYTPSSCTFCVNLFIRAIATPWRGFIVSRLGWAKFFLDEDEPAANPTRRTAVL